jgi:hypothetical protein
MIDLDEAKEWYNENGDEEWCSLCNTYVPVRFLCEDTDGCSYYYEEREDE